MCSRVILGKPEIESPVPKWSRGPGGWKAAKMVGDVKVRGKVRE